MQLITVVYSNKLLNALLRRSAQRLLAVSIVLFTMHTNSLLAAVLPADRSDVMYHQYSGDGVTIDGPSILLRKQVGNHVSLSANYYVDTVSGASIDVRATASAYVEQRKEASVGADFLHDKTLLSLNVTNSSENDFEANSVYAAVSQSFFGDLSTVSLSWSKGDDDVFINGDESFAQDASRQKFGLGLTQILTKSLIVGFASEHISDQGYLNNPYRSIRYVDDSADRGFSFAREVYPNTRSSNAFSINANYYLPYRAAVYFDARTYSDSWGITAKNAKLGYIHPIKNWTIDLFVRLYRQTSADFYGDLFSRENEFNFMARDKELSTYSGITAAVHVGYEWQFSQSSAIQKAALHLEYDYLRFDYDNFRDVTVSNVEVGDEPLFGFSAYALKLYASVWY